LAQQCNACGKPIGGAYNHYQKCNIWFCWYCGYVLQTISEEYPPKCQMVAENRVGEEGLLGFRTIRLKENEE